MSSASIGRDTGGDQHGSDDVRVKPDNTSSRKCVVEFTANTVSVYEGEKKARIGVKRVGNVSARVSVKYETCNGTAEAGTDFVAQKDFLIFEPQEKLKLVDTTFENFPAAVDFFRYNVICNLNLVLQLF